MERQFHLKTTAKYLIFILTTIILNYVFDTTCERQRQVLFRNLTFSGVLSRKYIDTKQHQYNVIELLHAKATKKYIISIDESGLFGYLSRNDSIVKSSGVDEVIVYRNLKPKVFIGTEIYLYKKN